MSEKWAVRKAAGRAFTSGLHLIAATYRTIALLGVVAIADASAIVWLSHAHHIPPTVPARHRPAQLELRERHEHLARGSACELLRR